MITIIDYGMANLRSVEKSFARAGGQVTITGDPALIEASDGVVLPGVGAFGEAMRNLTNSGLVPAIERVVARGTPFLGICLGMQLLFDESEELGQYEGLHLLPGRVLRLPNQDAAGNPLVVPHIGWNSLDIRKPSALMDGILDHAHVYFVHSFYCAPSDPTDIVATTEYGLPFCSVVERGNIYGAQFHPEKSQAVGLRMLRNWLDVVQAHSGVALAEGARQ